ncbi:alpha [Colletotrichum tofieldiae]|nr:alpha [Colletotrichum tofieldiae]GKT78766.1 alpha [Colletotrichum tofieldiae]GKT87022.1 alpha [Colletotrichum tofieldiae]
MVKQIAETAPENLIVRALAHSLQTENAATGKETAREKRTVIGQEISKAQDCRQGPEIIAYRIAPSPRQYTASRAIQQIHASTVAQNHITAALQQLSQRSNELGALQLQKDVVERRARAREKDHAQSHPKYVEFPSLKDFHQKLEKRDAEDLNALLREVSLADQRWLTSAEGFATTLLQAFVEQQQQDKDRRSAVSGSSSSEDLETRLNSRLDALDKQHKDEAAKQKKQIEDLQKGLSTETALRKILGIENESLKKKVQDLQDQKTSLTTKVDEHGTSIKRLQEEKSEVVPLHPAPQKTTITSEDLSRVETMVDQCRNKLIDLETKMVGHDQKLGEMDVDLITEGCFTIAATLPRLEQNAKRAADEISVLRTDHDKLRSDNAKLRLDTDVLQSEVKQFQSGMEQLRSEALEVRSSVEHLKFATDQLKSGTEHLNTNVEQLKSEMTQLRSGAEESQLAVEKLQSAMQGPPAGDSFLTVKTFTTMNTAVFKTFSGWIDDLKKRADAVEGQIPTLQTVSKQQIDQSSQIKVIEDQVRTLKKGSEQQITRSSENSHVPTPAPDTRGFQYEEKWREHDTRLKALEASSRRSPYHSASAASEPTGAVDAVDALAQRRAPIESMNAAIETLKAQVAMADQSINAVSESAKFASDSLASQAERVSQLENELRMTGKRLGTAEQTLQATGERVERKLEFMQQNFTSLDSQMNNLTTENLFQAIIQHIDRYQPAEAVIGHKVERIFQQMTAYEQRLAVLEQSVASSEEPANKRRKLSPHIRQMGMTNGRH